MTKGNKIRLMFWGFIWLIVLITTILGIYSYYNGKGISGKIRKELLPYINEFNNLNELNIYKNAGINVKAKYSKNAIKVNYKTSNSNLAYIFDYKEMDGTKVLYMKYNETSDNTAKIVIREMLDAVSIVNGHNEGDIFNTINYNDLYNLSLKDGISIKYDNNNVEIYIDVNKSVADHITGKENKYISKDEISNINDELIDNNYFKYTKNDIIIYVKNTEDKYIVYGQNTNYDDDLYKSISNVISSLNINGIIINDFEMNYPSISTNKEFGNYNIIINDEANDINEFKSKNNIIKIEIKKDISEN